MLPSAGFTASSEENMAGRWRMGGSALGGVATAAAALPPPSEGAGERDISRATWSGVDVSAVAWKSFSSLTFTYSTFGMGSAPSAVTQEWFIISGRVMRSVGSFVSIRRRRCRTPGSVERGNFATVFLTRLWSLSSVEAMNGGQPTMKVYRVAPRE